MALTQQEEAYITEQEAQMKVLREKYEQSETSSAQVARDVQNFEKNIIQEQLDLSQELDTIEHLLRGHVLKENPKAPGIRSWVESEEADLSILTEHGIYLIMNTIMFYINKNTLLSNYSEEVINQKMEDFATDLCDTIFMEYEKVFKSPTFKDVKDVFYDKIQKKVDLRKFSLELLGKEVDEQDIKEQFLEEIEERIELEMGKIKEQIMKNKLKRFLIIIREVQDAVHSTYLRAYQGQERRTLREHIHISESRGDTSMPKRPSKLNPLNFFLGGR